MDFELYCNKKTVENATWADVEAVLPELKEEAFFTLCIEPRPESGPVKLEIQSENGNYMPSVLVYGDSNKVFVNPDGRGKEDVSIGGYDVYAMAVTQDFDLIKTMIREFYETGDVSCEMMK